MFDKADLLKKMKMVWDKNSDIGIRGNLIREYLEKLFQYIGLDSDKYILMIVDFEEKKDVTSSLKDMIVIKMNYLNMNGELEPLIEAIDELMNRMKTEYRRSYYEIGDLSKKIKR